jgi:hypothetical protein
MHGLSTSLTGTFVLKTFLRKNIVKEVTKITKILSILT